VTESSEIMPLTGISVIQEYVNLLRSVYGSLGLFLFDPYARPAQHILVQWKSPFFQKHPIEDLAEVKFNEINISGDEFTYDPESLIESFKMLGHGLVSTISAQIENWPLQSLA
jgi:hypothetical protein